jgi:hypothetical protein
LGEAKIPCVLAAWRVAQTIQPTPISLGVPVRRIDSTRQASPSGPSSGARNFASVGLTSKARCRVSMVIGA